MGRQLRRGVRAFGERGIVGARWFGGSLDLFAVGAALFEATDFVSILIGVYGPNQVAQRPSDFRLQH